MSDAPTATKEPNTKPFAPETLARAQKVAATYSVLIEPNPDGGFFGRTREMDMVMGDGKTYAECLKAVGEATVAAVATMIEKGQEPPEAAPAMVPVSDIDTRELPPGRSYNDDPKPIRRLAPREPKVGDTLLFFHSGYTSGPYKGRACLIVEDEGGGRYGVQIFKNAADRREGVKDRAVDNGYVSGVLFCADAELQPNRRGTGWRWPANGNCFIAWETPAIAGIGQADDEDMSDASVRGPVKGPNYVMPDTCACGGQNGRHLPNCPVRLQQKLAPTVVQPPAAPAPAAAPAADKPMPLPPGAKPKKASGLELTQERDKVLERGPVVQTRRTGGAVGSFRGGNL